MPSLEAMENKPPILQMAVKASTDHSVSDTVKALLQLEQRNVNFDLHSKSEVQPPADFNDMAALRKILKRDSHIRAIFYHGLADVNHTGKAMCQPCTDLSAAKKLFVQCRTVSDGSMKGSCTNCFWRSDQMCKHKLAYQNQIEENVSPAKPFKRQMGPEGHIVHLSSPDLTDLKEKFAPVPTAIGLKRAFEEVRKDHRSIQEDQKQLGSKIYLLQKAFDEFVETSKGARPSLNLVESDVTIGPNPVTRKDIARKGPKKDK